MPLRVNQQARQDSRKRPISEAYVEKRKRELNTEGFYQRDDSVVSKKVRPFDPRWEEALQEAIYFKNRHLEASFRFLARRFQPEYTTRVLYPSLLERRWNGKTRSLLSNRGHLKVRHLSDADELGIMEILDRYQYIGTPLRLGLLRGVANQMLKDRAPKDTPMDDIPTVGRDWPLQFIKRHSD
ncbi:hypothetical protein DL95DRAFT_388244 [Leptodontidium sp. 2 PMI_412]|nr:hypothetical protein DL95DRAFT_388244 [Leptodontidium sp. 2 PMI_412]